MRNTWKRAAALTLGTWIAIPAALSAHPGHPWLEGAAQPMLGLDHFLAAMLVVVGVTLGLMSVAKRRSAVERTSPGS